MPRTNFFRKMLRRPQLYQQRIDLKLKLDRLKDRKAILERYIEKDPNDIYFYNKYAFATRRDIEKKYGKREADRLFRKKYGI